MATLSNDHSNYDLLIKNVRLVRPSQSDITSGSIAVRDGKIVALGSNVPGTARTVVDGKNLLAFPGVVDAHMHTGIYSPLAEDAVTESRAAAQGGVTSSLNYFRSGQYYLNKGGPYEKFFPEVLEIS
ncbi:MAG: hydantoinase, partial [Pseudomonadota bacterium]